jgi:hypothetical protein
MIVKIFQPTASFEGVRYNTNKMERNKGELMKVSGFGPLQGLGILRPEDYVNYLEMLSAQNKRVELPQFHAVISAKGKEYDKNTLTVIAEKWLVEMGYSRQPYLIVFHKDTGNNHVHMVSTRVDKQGRKIFSAFEHNRAIQNLNKVMSVDEKYSIQMDIDKALSYNFSTKAQFLMILESQGYVVKDAGQQLEVIKYGKKQLEISLGLITEKIRADEPDKKRQAQLKAIFEKYSQVYDTSLHHQTIPLPGGLLQPTKGHTSAFADFLHEKFGINLLFHVKDGKPPYGYSIIDHGGKAVWKGSEVMPLKELLNKTGQKQFSPQKTEQILENLELDINPEAAVKDYYTALLKAALYNYPDLAQGLHHQGLLITEQDREIILTDSPAGKSLPVASLLTDFEMADLQEARECERQGADVFIRPVSISPDVDDEAINGRNRRKKKKARTNTR